MKNILIISTSLRKGGNSETLARAFADGAKSSGHSTEIVSLAGKIGFYDEMHAALDQIKKDIYEAIEM